MLGAPLVITFAIVALIVIYFLPWIDDRARRAYGRWRRRRREEREQKARKSRASETP
jgi:uncharacterized protein HemY